ncbi:MAG: hypothetical protein ACTFAL_00215 [Candidatus Electronema sp. V4]
MGSARKKGPLWKSALTQNCSSHLLRLFFVMRLVGLIFVYRRRESDWLLR